MTAGKTDIDEPETVPRPLLIDMTGVEPETDQDRVEELPLVIEEGEEVKDEIVGGDAGDTPPEPVAS